jgi:hypothetical protein
MKELEFLKGLALSITALVVQIVLLVLRPELIDLDHHSFYLKYRFILLKKKISSFFFFRISFDGLYLIIFFPFQ